MHIVNGGYSSFYGRPATAINVPHHRDLCATEITVLHVSGEVDEGVPLTRVDFQTYLDWLTTVLTVFLCIYLGLRINVPGKKTAVIG